MRDGAVFPPIIVYFDGKSHWVADGCYRCQAAERAKRSTILAELRRGELDRA